MFDLVGNFLEATRDDDDDEEQFLWYGWPTKGI